MAGKFFAHATTDVSPGATIGDGTKIWQHCQIREKSIIGQNCVLGKDVYVDYMVQIGNNVKIQNGVSVYQGVTLEDGVFCGPHCVFTNDMKPRAVTPEGVLKTTDEWHVSETLVKLGASIGAHATIVCGVKIGRWAMIGAGAVVTRDVPDHGLAYGNPAQLHGFICPCGEALKESAETTNPQGVPMSCPKCKVQIVIPKEDHDKMLKNRRSK